MDLNPLAIVASAVAAVAVVVDSTVWYMAFGKQLPELSAATSTPPPTRGRPPGKWGSNSFGAWS
jgi:hypothetical protein